MGGLEDYKINIEIKNVCANDHKFNKYEERVEIFTNSVNYSVCAFFFFLMDALLMKFVQPH